MIPRWIYYIKLIAVYHISNMYFCISILYSLVYLIYFGMCISMSILYV
jgi:hypothetical protein